MPSPRFAAKAQVDSSLTTLMPTAEEYARAKLRSGATTVEGKRCVKKITQLNEKKKKASGEKGNAQDRSNAIQSQIDALTDKQLTNDAQDGDNDYSDPSCLFHREFNSVMACRTGADANNPVSRTDQLKTIKDFAATVKKVAEREEVTLDLSVEQAKQRIVETELKQAKLEVTLLAGQITEVYEILEQRRKKQGGHSKLPTLDDASFLPSASALPKRPAAGAPPEGEAKKQKGLRANSLDANAIREMFVTSLTDALSPGEIDTDERNELLDKQEDLGLDDDEFFRIIGGLGWSRRDFMRGKKNSGKKLAVKSRVELVKSASSTPTTRAGVDDDGSDSD